VHGASGEKRVAKRPRRKEGGRREEENPPEGTAARAAGFATGNLGNAVVTRCEVPSSVAEEISLVRVVSSRPRVGHRRRRRAAGGVSAIR